MTYSAPFRIRRTLASLPDSHPLSFGAYLQRNRILLGALGACWFLGIPVLAFYGALHLRAVVPFPSFLLIIPWLAVALAPYLLARWLHGCLHRLWRGHTIRVLLQKASCR
jgi:hypothetical protein